MASQKKVRLKENDKSLALCKTMFFLCRNDSQSDDNYLRDNRTWTSTRDRHLEMPGLESDEELNTHEILIHSVAKSTKTKEPVLLSELLSD